jgi:hypothetical protein
MIVYSVWILESKVLAVFFTSDSGVFCSSFEWFTRFVMIDLVYQNCVWFCIKASSQEQLARDDLFYKLFKYQNNRASRRDDYDATRTQAPQK